MIVCSKCGKENQDHYKFCLGCGAELSAADAVPGEPAAEPAGPPAISADTPVDQSRDDLLPTVPPGAVVAPPAGVGGIPGPAAPAPASPFDAPAGAAPASSPFDAPAPTPVPAPAASPFGDLPPLQPSAPAPAPAAAPIAPAPIAPGPAAPTPAAPTPTGPAPADPPPAAAGSEACPTCGAPNPTGFTFCGNCGTRLKQAQQPDALASPAPAPQPQAGPVATMSLIRPDGSEGGVHEVLEAEVTIGRGSGPLFDSDAYLSPQHARFVFEQDQLMLEDLGSLNGVFMRTSESEPLLSGDIFRIGQELLRFDAIGEPGFAEDGSEVLGSPNPGYWGRLSLIVGRNVDGSAFPLMGDEMVLGRERGDILFSDDGYVSGTHAKISLTEAGEVFLTDLGSSNGTFIRLAEPRTVPFGTFILIGQQLFRIDKA